MFDASVIGSLSYLRTSRRHFPSLFHQTINPVTVTRANKTDNKYNDFSCGVSDGGDMDIIVHLDQSFALR